MLLFNGALSAPTCELKLAPESSIGKRDVPSTRFVIYSDKFVSGLTGPPPVSEIEVRTAAQPPRPMVYAMLMLLHRRATTFCECTPSALARAPRVRRAPSPTAAHTWPRTRSALSFLLLSGPADKALEWSEQLTADQRTSVKADYVAAGISLIVSAFGSTDAPTSTGADPTSTANTMAAWVKEFDLDGIDVDYEVRPAGGRCTFFS